MTHDEQIKALMETIKSQKQTHAALIKKLKNYKGKMTLPLLPHPKAIELMEEAYMPMGEMEAAYDALIGWMIEESHR